MTRALVVLVALGWLIAMQASAQERSWRGAAVLMYHRVDREVPASPVGRSLTVSPAAFAAQLAWLRAHGLRAITAAALIDGLARGARPGKDVVLTFDDGYEDAATTVLPLLLRYGAHASFYVSADLIGSPHHLSWKELRALRDAGMEVACHGSRHYDLTTLSAHDKEYEIGHCATALSHYLGERPRTYVYAAGAYDAATIAVVKQHGFEAAFTEHPGAVDSLARPFELPRRRVDRDDTLAAFAGSAVP